LGRERFDEPYLLVSPKRQNLILLQQWGVNLALDLNQSLDNEYLAGKYDGDELSFLMDSYEEGGAFCGHRG
jgi:hypothetical protein